MITRSLQKFTATAILACCCIYLFGCSSSDSGSSEAAVSPGSLSLCTDCGQSAGGQQCGLSAGGQQCSLGGQEKSASCELDAGSPECCKIKKGSGDLVAMCTGCGQIKGSDTCCKPGQPICDGCGMVKGSPGCCK